MGRGRRLCLLLAIVAIASGYRMIRPDVHESMTRAAKKCFDRAMRATSKPDICLQNLTVRASGKEPFVPGQEVEIGWASDAAVAVEDTEPPNDLEGDAA